MTKLSFAAPAVDLSVQGETFTVDPTSFAPIALEAIFTYGVRRWFQDNINSAAHAHKLAKAEAEAKGEAFTGDFDVQAAFTSRLQAATSGELSPARGRSASPAWSPLEEAMYTVAAESRTAPAFKPVLVAWGEAKGASAAERKSIILRAVASLPPKALAAIRSAAEARLALSASLSDLDL